MAFKTFVNGFPLNASELNEFLMSQVVATFVDATARTAAIETPIEGQLTYLSGNNSYESYNGTAWVALGLPGGVSAKTANYTTVASDVGFTINSTSTAITITISNTLSAGQRIDFLQTGAGQITFAAGAGVTLNSKGAKLKTAGQYSAATVICLASGSYILIGDLGA